MTKIINTNLSYDFLVANKSLECFTTKESPFKALKIWLKLKIWIELIEDMQDILSNRHNCV